MQLYPREQKILMSISFSSSQRAYGSQSCWGSFPVVHLGYSTHFLKSTLQTIYTISVDVCTPFQSYLQKTKKNILNSPSTLLTNTFVLLHLGYIMSK